MSINKTNSQNASNTAIIEKVVGYLESQSIEYVKETDSFGRISLECNIPVSLIENPPENEMLRGVKPKKVAEIKASILKDGQLYRILVQAIEKDGVLHFYIADGLQRLSAMRELSKDLNTDFIAKVVISDRFDLLTSILGNVKRENQNVTEVAKACMRLISDYGYSFADVGRELGISQEESLKMFRLNDLSPEEFDSLKKGEISVTFGTLIVNERKKGMSDSRIEELKLMSRQSKTQEEIRSQIKTWKEIDAIEEKKERMARGEDISLPAFNYQPKFSMERFETLKIESDRTVYQAESEERELTVNELAVKKAIDFCMQNTPEDIETAKKRHVALYTKTPKEVKAPVSDAKVSE